MKDSQKKIPADEVKYPDSTPQEVAHDAAQWIVGLVPQWIVNVFDSKNFWLYLAAIVALRAYLSTLMVFYANPSYILKFNTWWGKFKNDWWEVFHVIFDSSLIHAGTLLHHDFAPHFLFIGFCLLMNAIRKSK